MAHLLTQPLALLVRSLDIAHERLDVRRRRHELRRFAQPASGERERALGQPGASLLQEPCAVTRIDRRAHPLVQPDDARVVGLDLGAELDLRERVLERARGERGLGALQMGGDADGAALGDPGAIRARTRAARRRRRGDSRGQLGDLADDRVAFLLRLQTLRHFEQIRAHDQQVGIARGRRLGHRALEDAVELGIEIRH